MIYFIFISHLFIIMSTIKVAPETTWSFPNVGTSSTSSVGNQHDFPMVISQDEYMYLFLLVVVVGIFLWTFKKRV